MSQYKLTFEELTEFARKIYEESCGGYLDLKDSICDKLVRNFVDGRNIIVDMPSVGPVTHINCGISTNPPMSNIEFSRPEYAGPENNEEIWSTWSSQQNSTGSGGQVDYAAIHDWAIAAGRHSGDQIQMVGNGNTIQLTDEASVSPRSTEELVRPDENLRTNYEGNESERF